MSRAGGNIQNAINAAHSGATISLAPCTYAQQLVIDKSVTIVGSGPGRTTIQSPGTLLPDSLGNLWGIEVGNGATVVLSGFTFVASLQCIMISALYPATGVLGYAEGGIGVGGSAYLDLQSAVITTPGQAEGASCDGGAGIISYGTGVGFGLDYLTGSPSTSQLVGFGAISGVTLTGYAYGGADIAVGGGANSPAGSSALIAHDRILTIGTTNPSGNCPCAVGVAVGDGGSASSATIVDNTVAVVAPQTTDFPLLVNFGSYAYIAHNSIIGGGWGDGVTVGFSSSATITENSIVLGPGVFPFGIAVLYSSWASITYNSIMGPAITGWGIYMYVSSAAIEFNSIGLLECEYNPSLGAPGSTCGPSWATQYAGYAILDASDAGLGTTIASNFVVNTDVGILLYAGCPACVVESNTLVNEVYYGLAGADGSYAFLQNTIIGGQYGVASIAYTVNTAVTLSHVSMIGQTVDPFYYEVDFSGGIATIVGK